MPPSIISFVPSNSVPGVGSCGDILACITTSSNTNPTPTMCQLKVSMDVMGTSGTLEVREILATVRTVKRNGGGDGMLSITSSSSLLRPKSSTSSSRPASPSSSMRGIPGGRTAMRAASRRNEDQRFAHTTTTAEVSSSFNNRIRAASPQQQSTPSSSSPRVGASAPALMCSIPLPLRLTPTPLTGSSIMIPMRADESRSLVLVFQRQDTMVRFVTLLEVIRTKADAHPPTPAPTTTRRAVPIRRAQNDGGDPVLSDGEEGCPAMPCEDRLVASPIRHSSSNSRGISTSLPRGGVNSSSPHHHHPTHPNGSSTPSRNLYEYDGRSGEDEGGKGKGAATGLNTTTHLPLYPSHGPHRPPPTFSSSSPYVPTRYAPPSPTPATPPPPTTAKSASVVGMGSILGSGGVEDSSTSSPYVYMAQTMRNQASQSQAKFDATLDSYRRTEERRRREIDQLFEERDRRRAEFLAKRGILRDDEENRTTYTNHAYPEKGEEGGVGDERDGSIRGQSWKAFTAMSDAVGRKWEQSTVDVESLLIAEGRGRRRKHSVGMAEEDPVAAEYCSRVMGADLETLTAVRGGSPHKEEEDPMAALIQRIEADSSSYGVRHYPSTSAGGSHYYGRAGSSTERPQTYPSTPSRPPTPPVEAVAAAPTHKHDLVEHSDPPRREETGHPTVDPLLAAAREAEARLLGAVSLAPLSPPHLVDEEPAAVVVATAPPVANVPLPAAPAVTNPTPGGIPAGWKEKQDPASGRTYYYRPSDKKTVWTLDAARKLEGGTELNTTSTVAASTPAGWKEMKDPATGRTYYCRLADKKTVWSLDAVQKLAANESPISDIPAGWKEKQDPASGRTYYYRPSDKKTVWTLDAARKLEGGITQSVTTSEIPAGWKEKQDPASGRTYYYRPSDKKTVWTLDAARKLQ